MGNTSDINNKRLFFIGCFCVSILYLFFFYFSWYGRIDGDALGDMLIARETARTHHLFPTSIFYSTTLPSQYIGNIGIASILFLVISDIKIVFLLSRIIETVIIMFVMYKVLRVIRVQNTSIFLFMALFVLPTNIVFYLQWMNGMYTWTLLVFFLNILLLYKMEHTSTRFNKIICLVCMLIISGVEGISGIKSCIWIYVPLAMAIWITAYHKRKINILNKEIIAISLVVSVNLLCWQINEKCLLHKYGITMPTGFKFSPTNKFGEKIGNVFSSLLCIFGYQNDVNFISVDGIRDLLAIVFLAGFCLLLIQTILLIYRESLSEYQEIVALFSIIGLGIMVFLNIFTEAPSGSNYLVPSIEFSILLIPICFFNTKFQKVNSFIVIIVLGLGYVLNAKVIYENAINSTTERTWKFHEIADQLQTYGFTYGYASFWNSCPIMLETNQDIEVANIGFDREQGKIYRDIWLSEKKLYDPEYYEGNVFVLLQEDEKELFSNSLLLSENLKMGTPLYEDGQYSVYVFTNDTILSMFD